MLKSCSLRMVRWLIAALICLILLFEVGVRVFWAALPEAMRAGIVGVRIVPWSEERLTLLNFRVDAAAAQTATLDVLIVGDSFAFCWMDSEECWAAQLNARGWRALSAASLGSGSAVQLETLQRLLPNLQPRLIVWQWYYNDAEDNCRLARRAQLAQAPSQTPPEAPRGGIGSGVGQYSALARIVGNWLRQRANAPLQAPPTPPVSDSELPCEGNMASVLSDYDAGIALAAEYSARVIIALVPYIDEIEDAQAADSSHEAARRLHHDLLVHCAERGYHCVDPTETLRAAHEGGQAVYKRADLHLTAQGNRLFAEALIAYIEEHGLLPPP